MTNGNSLINLGDLSKPATALIERISDAVGGVCKPWQIIRVAKAEAKADKIKAIAKIEVTKLQQRALQRFAFEEAKRQENIEKITSQALPQLTKNAKPEEMETDWITNFFDKCRLISDEEMQNLWSSILAGEANSPGKFSKRTVNFISLLEKQEAVLFTNLCAFSWIIDDMPQPLIYDVNEEIYLKHGINFSVLKHLDTIGLISFDALSGYQLKEILQTLKVAYQGKSFVLEFQKEKDNRIGLGKVMFTGIGKELASICGPDTVPGFDSYIIQKWADKGIKVLSQEKSSKLADKSA